MTSSGGRERENRRKGENVSNWEKEDKEGRAKWKRENEKRRRRRERTRKRAGWVEGMTANERRM